MKKIHICGIHGSGKTYLAKVLSSKLKIPYYSLDDLKYYVKWSKKRSIEEIRKKIKEIVNKEEWITEDSWGDYAEECFKKANFVVVLASGKLLSKYRIIKRYLFRRKKENDTWRGVFKLIKRINPYYSSSDPKSFRAHIGLIKKYGKRYVILRNSREIKKFVNNIEKTK